MSWEEEMEEEKREAGQVYNLLCKKCELPALMQRGYSKLEERYLKRGKKTWRSAFALYYFASCFFWLFWWFVVWVLTMLFLVCMLYFRRIIPF